jgi:hypothetical protein
LNFHREIFFPSIAKRENYPYFLFLLTFTMFAITKCKFDVDIIVVYEPKKTTTTKKSPSDLFFEHFFMFLKLSINDREEILIKIHRDPIYLHYCLLQMCFKSCVSKPQRYLCIKSFGVIFHYSQMWWFFVGDFCRGGTWKLHFFFVLGRYKISSVVFCHANKTDKNESRNYPNLKSWSDAK